MDISAYQHMNIRMSTRGKRPLRNLTPSDKVRAIQRIHNGETKASVSRDIGVPESTLRGWCKNEQKLRFMCRQLGTADQLSNISTIDNPPEKRPRFENLIQTPKYPGTTTFDEFSYNRLFSPNRNNAILEKIALNEIMKKHNIMPSEGSDKILIDSTQIPTVIGSPVSLNAEYNTQLSMLQNLNLLSLLSPNMVSIQNLNTTSNGSMDTIRDNIPLRLVDDSKESIKNNFSNNTNTNNVTLNNNSGNNIISNKSDNSKNISATLSVKNWAKDPVEKSSMNFVMIDSSISNINKKKHNNSNPDSQNVNDINNKNLKEKSRLVPLETLPDVNFPPPLSLGVSQLPNGNNVTNSENENTALLEWCKVFNASLNFLALAAAAAALQPNGAFNAPIGLKKEGNILYKELTKSTNNFDSTTNLGSFINSDISNDSYIDSEPEDLSVRSTTTSKISSPANSRSQSPINNDDSCSPMHSG